MPERDANGATFEEWAGAMEKPCDKCGKPALEHEAELVSGYWFAQCIGIEKPKLPVLPWRPFKEKLTETRMRNLVPDASEGAKVESIQEYMTINGMQRIAQQAEPQKPKSARTQKRYYKKLANKYAKKLK